MWRWLAKTSDRLPRAASNKISVRSRIRQLFFRRYYACWFSPVSCNIAHSRRHHRAATSQLGDGARRRRMLQRISVQRQHENVGQCSPGRGWDMGLPSPVDVANHGGGLQFLFLQLLCYILFSVAQIMVVLWLV